MMTKKAMAADQQGGGSGGRDASEGPGQSVPFVAVASSSSSSSPAPPSPLPKSPRHQIHSKEQLKADAGSSLAPALPPSSSLRVLTPEHQDIDEADRVAPLLSPSSSSSFGGPSSPSGGFQVLPGERRGSTASSHRVRRKAVPGGNSTTAEATSPRSVAASLPDEGGALGLARRRSSAHSQSRPSTAPATKAPSAENGAALNVKDAPASPRSTRSAKMYPDTTLQSVSPDRKSTSALPVPSPRQRAASIDRPATAPISAAPARLASKGRDTIMIDGQAFIIDDEDDEQVRKSRLSTLRSLPSPVRTAPRAIDLSERSKAAADAEHKRTASLSSSQAPGSKKPVYQWHLKNGGVDRRPGTAPPQPHTPPTSPQRQNQVLASPSRSTVRSRRPGTAMSGIAAKSTRALGLKGSQSLDFGPRKTNAKGKEVKEAGSESGAYAIQKPSALALQEAANVHIYDEECDKVRFGDLFLQQRTLVCFLRHWFCPMCQEFAMSMKQIDPLPLQRAGLGLIVVGQGHPEVIGAYKRVMGVPEWIKMFSDPSRKTYQILGMNLKTNDPGPACAKPDYITMTMFKGSMTAIKKSLFEMPIRSPGDLKLLGGEFILGPGLDCSFVHRMTTTRGHLDLPRILTQAGCDMTLKTPRALDSEDGLRPESVKSAGARRSKRSATGLRSVRSIARNFENQRRVSSAKVDGSLSSSKRSQHATTAIPAVPKLPATVNKVEARDFAKPAASPQRSPRKAPKRLSSEFQASMPTNKVRSTPSATPRSEAKRLSEERAIEADLRRYHRENGDNGESSVDDGPAAGSMIDHGSGSGSAKSSLKQSLEGSRPRMASLDGVRRPTTSSSSSSRPSSSEVSRNAAVLARGPQNADVPLLRSKRSWLSTPMIRKASSTPDLNAELEHEASTTDASLPATLSSASTSSRPPSASSSVSQQSRGSKFRALASHAMLGSRTTSNDGLRTAETMSIDYSTPRQSADLHSLHSLRSATGGTRSPNLGQSGGPSSSSASTHSRSSIPLNLFEKRIIGGAGAGSLFGGAASSASSTKTTTPPVTPRLGQDAKQSPALGSSGSGYRGPGGWGTVADDSEYSAPRLHERQQQRDEGEAAAADAETAKSRRAAAHLSRISERPERMSTFTAAESEYIPGSSPPLPPLPSLPEQERQQREMEERQEQERDQRESSVRPSTDSRMTSSSLGTSDSASSSGGSSTTSRGSPRSSGVAAAGGFGGGSFLDDLDVVFDGFGTNRGGATGGATAGSDVLKNGSSRDLASSAAGRGPGNRDTYYSEDYEGYRTSLDSWRSSPSSLDDDEEQAADEDSDDLEHEPGWTRPPSLANTASSGGRTGSRSQGAGPRSKTVGNGRSGKHSHSRNDSSATMRSSLSAGSTDYRSSMISSSSRGRGGGEAGSLDSAALPRASYDSRAGWMDEDDLSDSARPSEELSRGRPSYEDEYYSSGSSSGGASSRGSYEERDPQSANTGPTTASASSSSAPASKGVINRAYVARRAIAQTSTHTNGNTAANGNGTASPTPSTSSSHKGLEHAAHRFGQGDMIQEEMEEEEEEEEEEEDEDALQTPKVKTRELPREEAGGCEA
ncbi:hypothetical protein BDZ90DRAFT_229952 [Jaminaea rosea]|uniref:Uncharacterized protein n=1 Tax=Jaminaea rosea TaxID=1569628 RepID=A0A316V082_9BASI|nr:hypothetical protein BDZ90DRAFT_229952 [Jaminaea rosea]PWN30960.1 hypothetical protein BDZ90DRAFT_229952 [Jaminaea rosea]